MKVFKSLKILLLMELQKINDLINNTVTAKSCEEDSDCVVSQGGSCCNLCPPATPFVVNQIESKRLAELRAKDCQEKMQENPPIPCPDCPVRAMPQVMPWCRESMCTVRYQTLLEIKSIGGDCPNQTCDTHFSVQYNGAWTSQSFGKKIQGTVNQDSILNFQEEMENANFIAIRSKPFTETCPTAYDGQEYTYIFYTSHGKETLSSCQTAIDFESPLFQAVNEIQKDRGE